MNEHASPSAIVLVIDQLSAWLLGPYGNTWFETASFNRLASQSLLFDQCIADSPDLERAYRGLWFGSHAIESPESHATKTHLVDALLPFGVSSILVADPPTSEATSGRNVGAFETSEAFERVVNIDVEEPETLADSIANTYFVNYFAQAIDLVSKVEPGELLWLHCQGLSGPWDAPIDLRENLADEEDPDPPTFVRLPQIPFNPETDDPDLLLGFQQACCAQVMILDDMLGRLLDQLDELDCEVMFALVSPRGMPLGEHSHIGNPGSLHREVTHVPMMIRTPQSAISGQRSQRLVQPRDLRSWIEGWFDPETKGPLPSPVDDDADRQCVVSAMSPSGELEEGLALQTREWKYISKTANSASELYAKPDDSWEVNNVRDRAWADAKHLKKRLKAAVEALQQGQQLDDWDASESESN